MLNNINIMGRLTRDPELRTTNSGISVTSFTVACERDYKDKNNNEYPVDFLDIVAWKTTAEFATKYFKKGQLVCIKGSLQTRKFTDKDNNKRTAYEIIAESVYFCEKKQNDANNGTPQNADYGEPPMAYPQTTGGNVPQDNEFNNMADDFYPEF